MLLRCKSAIMSNMDQKMEIRELHGTTYQIGFQSGSFFHGRVKIELDGIRSFMQQNKQAMEQMIRSREMLQYHYPSYYEETIGKADGLGIDRDVYMMLMHPEILQKGHESCTTIMVKNKNGTIILAHNEDDFFAKGNLCFVKVYTENGWFITNDSYHMPFGNGLCIHQSGLLRTINYCYDSPDDGYSRYFSQRHIAEADSIENLKKRALEMKLSSGYHVNVIDPAINQAFSLEVRNDGLHCRKVESFIVHTNHFVYDISDQKLSFQPGGNSLYRYETVMKQMEESTEYSLNHLQEILNMYTDDPMTSIFQCHKDDNRTLFRFTYDGRNHTSTIQEYEHGISLTMQEVI